MKEFKRVLAVFAHPDDEVFGPGGTLALMAQQGEVKIICVTDGVDTRRREELRTSAKILSVKEVVFLDYADGSLNHAVYHQVAKEITEYVKQWQPEVLLTFEPRGISGHLDHIAVAMITAYVFRENKQIKELWYFAELEYRFERAFKNKYFIYFPPGYRKEEMNKVVDTTSVYATQVKAMMAHETQRKDALQIMAQRTLLPKREYFLVKKRK